MAQLLTAKVARLRDPQRYGRPWFTSALRWPAYPQDGAAKA
jgi:hypothetical protein